MGELQIDPTQPPTQDLGLVIKKQPSVLRHSVAVLAVFK